MAVFKSLLAGSLGVVWGGEAGKWTNDGLSPSFFPPHQGGGRNKPEVRDQEWPPGSMHVGMCVCACVRVRERQRDRETERQRERESHAAGVGLSLPQGLIRTADSSSNSHCLTSNKCPQLSRTLFLSHESNFVGIPLLVSLPPSL